MRAEKTPVLLLTALLIVGIAMLAACGSDGDDDADGGDGGDERAVGSMNISEGTYLGQQSAKANASFKLVAESVCGIEVESFGQCSITTRTQPTCTPDCTAGQICAWKADCSSGECVDFVAFHAGGITITGATHQDSLTCSYNASLKPPKYECDVNTQQDVFEPGDQLHVVAAGDAFPAFDLTLDAPPGHSFTTDTTSWTTATFDGSEDVHLEWDTIETADEFKMTLISNAGNASLVCKFSDSGSFSIPKEGLTALGGMVVQVDIHRQNRLVVNEGADGEITILTVSGLALSIPGACYSCAEFNQACKVACPDESDVCPGASADAWTALDDCVCTECSTECELTCAGTGTDPDCKACRSAAMGAACSAERTACLSN